MTRKTIAVFGMMAVLGIISMTMSPMLWIALIAGFVTVLCLRGEAAE